MGRACDLARRRRSLRDRADLLVELLTAAGFTATVMSADRPSAIDLPTLYQVRAADFEPDETLYARAVALLPAGTVLSTHSPTPSDSVPAESPAEAGGKSADSRHSDVPAECDHSQGSAASIRACRGSQHDPKRTVTERSLGDRSAAVSVRARQSESDEHCAVRSGRRC